MKCAADFRSTAREALRGKWPLAVLVGFVASLFGAGIATSVGRGAANSSDSSDAAVWEVPFSGLLVELREAIAVAAAVLFIWMIVTLIIGGAIKLGYAIFNLKLADRKDVVFSDLFSQVDRLGAGFCMNFLIGLFTFLWSLLLVVPGIIKSFSYAMTPYILAENPELTATAAITQSRRVMDGNKWRLFCLELSFIGWELLCALPALIAVLIISHGMAGADGVGMLLWAIPCCSLCFVLSFAGSLILRPYQEAAHAVFYREVSGTEQTPFFTPGPGEWTQL